MSSRSIFLATVAMLVAVISTDAQDTHDPAFVLDGKVTAITKEPGTGMQVATVVVQNSPRVAPALGDLSGQQVEIALRNGPAAVTVGHTYRFNADGAGIGEGIRLSEISHSAVPSTTPFSAMMAFKLPHVQRLRLSQSDLVVSGRVASIGAVSTPVATPLGPPSLPREHSPNYQKWRLNIEQVIGGKSAKAMKETGTNKPIDIYVATNPDIAYVGSGVEPAPATTVGDTRVIALRWNSSLKGYVAIDSVDVRPATELQTIRTVMASQKEH
jgi:hypothetical protein